MSSVRNHKIRSRRSHVDSFRGASSLAHSARKHQEVRTERKTVAARLRGIFKREKVTEGGHE